MLNQIRTVIEAQDKINDNDFYYVRVNPASDYAAGKNGTYRKAVELRDALQALGLYAQIETETRVV